jgi:DNA-binding transcriptional MerR regulator
MSTPASATSSASPASDESTATPYSLEVIAELTGTEPRTILHYLELGLLKPEAPASFNDEHLHRLRRIEHLRTTCEMNSAGLKLMLHLLDEVERLQQERRRWQW